MGQSPDGLFYTNNPDDYILVQGNADLQNEKVVPRVWTKQITRIADVGDIIFSVRAPVGSVGKSDYSVVIGRGVASIKGNEFIFQTLKKMNDFGYWTNISCGSTFESINSNDLKSANIATPNQLEQSKIGTLFSNLDNLITLHQRKYFSCKILYKLFCTYIL